MKKVFIAFLLFFVCVFGGIVFWLSYSFNPEIYRERIIKNISEITGRKVEIAGDVSLTWSPFPTLTILKLNVLNKDNGSEPLMFSVEKIYAEIEWKSLLADSLVIKKVVVDKPVLLLERIRQYESNFDFPVLFKTIQNQDISLLDIENDFSLSIKNIEVNNGQFKYKNAVSQENFTFNKISGKGMISSLNGPFSFEGDCYVADKPINFDLKVGQIETSQNIPLNLNITDSVSETTIESKGHILQNSINPDEWINLGSRFASKKGNLFFQNIGIDKWPEGRLTGSFMLKIRRDRTVFENMIVRQGEGDSATSFSLALETDELSKEKIPTIVIRSIDYSRWKPFLTYFQNSSFFNKISGPFALMISEAKINSELLTQGTTRGEIKNGVITFSDLRATLPQGTSVVLNGTWNSKDQIFDTDLDLQTANLRGLTEWILGQKLDYLPEKGVDVAQLLGHLTLSQNKFLSNWKDSHLGKVEFSGDINFFKEVGQTLETKLKIKNLDLNTYHKLAIDDFKKIQFPNIGLIFDLKLQDSILGNEFFNGFNLNGELKENNLSLKSLSYEKDDNLTLMISGNIPNFGTPSILTQDLKGEFLLNKLPSNFPKNTLKEIKGTFTYSGNFEKGNFDSKVSFNKSEIKTIGEVENLFNNPQVFNMDVLVKSSDIQDVFSSFNATKDNFSKLSGPLDMSFKGSFSDDYLSADNIKATCGDQSINGNFKLNLKNNAIQADLKATEFNFNKFLPEIHEIKNNDFTFDIPTDLQVDLALDVQKGSYSGFQLNKIKSKMNLKDQILAFSEFGFLLANNGGKVSGNGRFILKDQLVADGKFYLEKIPFKKRFGTDALSLSEGVLTMGGDFSFSGNSWNDFLKSISSQGNLSIDNAVLSGVNISELSSVVNKSLAQYQSGDNVNVQVKHALSNGKTFLSNASGSFQLEQGNLSSPEIKMGTEFGDIFLRKLNYSILSEKTEATIAILLNLLKTLPTLDIEYKDGKIIFQLDAFEKGLMQEVDSLKKQKQEEQEKQDQKEAELRQNEILLQAQNILNLSETKIKRMKEMILLNPSAEAEELMNRSKGTLEEVRSLATKPDLNSEQLLILQEKSSILSLESKDLDDYLDRQEVLRQRDAVKKLPPLVKKRLDEMRQIYKQNPESAVLSGIVEKSQKENEKINANLEILPNMQDFDSVKNLISDIKESFQKIQKALNYARQFSSKTGMISGVSGAVSEGEI